MRSGKVLLRSIAHHRPMANWRGSTPKSKNCVTPSENCEAKSKRYAANCAEAVLAFGSEVAPVAVADIQVVVKPLQEFLFLREKEVPLKQLAQLQQAVLVLPHELPDVVGAHVVLGPRREVAFQGLEQESSVQGA